MGLAAWGNRGHRDATFAAPKLAKHPIADALKKAVL